MPKTSVKHDLSVVVNITPNVEFTFLGNTKHMIKALNKFIMIVMIVILFVTVVINIRRIKHLPDDLMDKH